MPEAAETTPETQPQAPTFEIGAEYIEDGKILGRYGSTQELLDALGSVPSEASNAPDPAEQSTQVEDPADPEALGGLQALQVEEPVEAPAGLTPDALNRYATEAVQQGKLGEESLKQLEAAGIDRSLAEDHVQGLLARRQLAAQEVARKVGGEQVVQNALAWAKDNLGAAERESVNAALASAPNAEVQALIIQGLVKRSGVIPNSVGGTNAAPITGQPYESEAQWLGDLKDPKYKSDPAFQAKVSQRLASTMKTGGFKYGI